MTCASPGRARGMRGGGGVPPCSPRSRCGPPKFGKLNLLMFDLPQEYTLGQSFFPHRRQNLANGGCIAPQPRHARVADLPPPPANTTTSTTTPTITTIMNG